jgi:predicted flap endonuclease-1-like 5' DNA nuclease
MIDVEHLATKRVEAAAAAALAAIVTVGCFALSRDAVLSMLAGGSAFVFAFFGLMAAEDIAFHAPARPAKASPLVAELAEDLSKQAQAVVAAAAQAVRPAPAALDRPADDLKRIKGIGPKLEAMLHTMDVRHFDQIAAWSPAEVAWMDANLEGFRGRVSRDDWVGQARVLAGGGDTDFSRRVERGDVPTSQG